MWRRSVAPTLHPHPIRRPGQDVLCQIRHKRYQAFGADLDQDALAEARKWHENFDAANLPKGETVFARSSGPGGQHVNKTESKAITNYAVRDVLAVLPKYLHSGVRSSKYYTAGSDSLTFKAQDHRSRSANMDENRRKFAQEIARIYREMTPNETSADKKQKHKDIETKFHASRIRDKKFNSAKKQSRRGPVE